MKNKEIDLTKILKDVPEGTKLWSNVYGIVEFMLISEKEEIIYFNLDNSFTKEVFKNGKLYNSNDSECILWPSKEIRDWSRWEEELKWREIEQWIVDGVCEFLRDVKTVEWVLGSYTQDFNPRNCGYTLQNFRKKPEVNPYQHLIDALTEGKQIERKLMNEDWRILIEPTGHFNYPVECYRIHDSYRELKEAYDRGEVIQYLSTEGWEDCVKLFNSCKNLEWSRPVEFYRIKPKEPKYVPFTFEDREMFRGKWVNAERDIEELIYSIDKTGIETMNYSYSFGEAFKCIKFIDGSPFGKLVES